MNAEKRPGAGKHSRQANMELLRCLAMMMVVVLHYLGKGELLADLSKDSIPLKGGAAWILESLCIVAVNLYMLLSGYFGWKSSFKPSRLLRLYLQIWFYSMTVGVVSYLVWGYPKDTSGTYFFLKLLFPVSMEHYWFMTAYVFLYLLLPFVGTAIRRMNQKQMKTVTAALLVVFCLVKSVLPVRFETDQKGYDVLWYLCMYVVGAYLGRFCAGSEMKASIPKASIPQVSIPKDSAQKAGWLLLYLAGAGAVLGELFLLHRVYVSTGKLGMLLTVSIEYNHIFTFAAAIGLFRFFEHCRINGKVSDVILKISPYTLGVYLLHENIGVRYRWQEWLGAGKTDGVLSLVLWTICAAVVVFAAGVLADFIRSSLENMIHRFLMRVSPYRRLTERILRMDESMRSLGQMREADE